MGKAAKNPEIREIFSRIGTLQVLPIGQLQNNTGQLKGVPTNPRYIKDKEYQTLKNSIEKSPELLDYKPLMVYRLTDDSYVTICGNMRLNACNDLLSEGKEFGSLPCLVLYEDTPIAKIKEYAIKDNVQAGNFDWDCLANDDWDVSELQEWGVDCNFLDDNNLIDPFENTEDLSEDTYKEPDKDYLECPFCHRCDTKSHFKHVYTAPTDIDNESIVD